MKAECDNYSQLNHDDCALDPYEKVVGDYFESRNFSVERLCPQWLPEGERTPDFHITDAKGFSCLCEVKVLSSSTGAMTEADWRYANHAEFEYLKQEAKKIDAQLIVRPDQLKLWKGEILYPEGGRNTEQKEKEYEKDIKERLHSSKVANLHLEITLHRRDSLIWTESEKEAFIADLIDKLSLLEKGELPRNWHEDFGIVSGHYTQRRENGYHIQNDIEIRKSTGFLNYNPSCYLNIAMSMRNP